MQYLVCPTHHGAVHLVCRADWLASALRHKGYAASMRGPAVSSDAPGTTVERLLSYNPPRHDQRFFSCGSIN
jgi:hypothetical protein